MGVRELSRYLQRDVKRTHEDAQILVELGLIEYCRDAKFCVSTHAEIHVDCALPASVGSTNVLPSASTYRLDHVLLSMTFSHPAARPNFWQ